MERRPNRAQTFASLMIITLPDFLSIDESIVRNPIRQLGEKGVKVEGAVIAFRTGRTHAFLFRPSDGGEEVVLLSKPARIPATHTRVLKAEIDPTAATADLSTSKWLRHSLSRSSEDRAAEIQSVFASWEGGFSYLLEDQSRDVIGLRAPQAGAVHAAHAHWTTSNGVATIVMPTGVGKTETMLSLLVSAPCSRLMVVVPTDALRTQLSNKFLTLGVLKEPNSHILRADAKPPIVCTLLHVPRDIEQVDEIFLRSQVVVTTSSIAAQCDPAVQVRMAELCDYLFVDEAHHSEAPTWKEFKDRFKNRRIVQFTATPFREDGKALDGKIIFKYPLKKAQEEGYFQRIRFDPVMEFNPLKSDQAIRDKAIEQLMKDRAKGHILMARVDSVARAEEVFRLYSSYAEFSPVQLHSGIASRREREEIRRRIIKGESRIVVCVDMLGEGFDLPELKIAAFHDIRKTLAVTLQLAGRFTRARPDLGEPTFIANIADVNVQDELKKLYARDPDWNILLPELSERLIREQVSLQEFLEGFTEFTDEIPLKSVRPATSTVVYRTPSTVWTPENFRDGIPNVESCEQVYHSINHSEHTLIVVTARKAGLSWTELESLFSWDWELYVVMWSPEQSLLYINGSANAGEYKALAEAVCGADSSLIKGQTVFRAFAGVNRLRFQNVGLSEQLGRNVRYTGRMGSNVEPGVPEIHRRRTSKSVLFGVGYENGAKTTVGASRKGRIWSQKREHVDRLASWCKAIGVKLLDDSIDPDSVLSGTLKVTTVADRPRKMPIGVDWPETVYLAQEALWSITIGDREFSLSELSLELVDADVDGPIRVAIVADDARAELDLELFETGAFPDYRFVSRSTGGLEVRRGTRAMPESAVDFFYSDPPIIWFADGSSLEGNQYIELRVTYPPYDPNKIEAWDWTGVNLRKESQGDEKWEDSIQAKVIRGLKEADYEMIIDDDNPGEAADIVTIRVKGHTNNPSRIEVEFFHCKFSLSDVAGARIKDLYEVCGQAQKSIAWMSYREKRTDLFTHLLRRESQRIAAGRPSRYERGDAALLQTIREMSELSEVSLKIFVVQPGLSKALVSRDQLELLSATENHLHETFQLSFGVIASP